MALTNMYVLYLVTLSSLCHCTGGHFELSRVCLSPQEPGILLRVPENFS